jgi:hypothetical protein
MIYQLPKSTRQAEQVWANDRRPIHCGGTLKMDYGRPRRTPYLYRRTALGFMYLYRHGWAGQRPLFLDLAKKYMVMYREAQREWANHFGLNHDECGSAGQGHQRPAAGDGPR